MFRAGTAGYVLRIREPEWFEHRVLKGADPAVNMHVFSPGCAELPTDAAVRNWLRAHDDDRALYARTKRELAQRIGSIPELRRRQDRSGRGDHHASASSP